jgi:hypothetical protein
VPSWLDQLREVLRDFYPPDGPADVLGYLKGSGDPNVWRLKALQNKPQLLILGSIPPSTREWEAAGKPGSDQIQTILNTHMSGGFIVLYGGMIYRPWGRIEIVDDDALKHYQSATINTFRRQIPKRP